MTSHILEAALREWLYDNCFTNNMLDGTYSMSNQDVHDLAAHLRAEGFVQPNLALAIDNFAIYDDNKGTLNLLLFGAWIECHFVVPDAMMEDFRKGAMLLDMAREATDAE